MPQHFVRTLCVPKCLALRCCTRKFTLYCHLRSQISRGPVLWRHQCIISKENDWNTGHRYSWNAPTSANTDYQSDYRCNSTEKCLVWTMFCGLSCLCINGVASVGATIHAYLLIHVRHKSSPHAFVSTVSRPSLPPFCIVHHSNAQYWTMKRNSLCPPLMVVSFPVHFRKNRLMPQKMIWGLQLSAIICLYNENCLQELTNHNILISQLTNHNVAQSHDARSHLPLYWQANSQSLYVHILWLWLCNCM